MTIVLTKPIGTGGGGTAIAIPNTIVQANSTLVVDTPNCVNGDGIKWLLKITDMSSSDTTMQEVMCVKNQTKVSHSRFGVVGTLLPHNIDVAPTANTVELAITNLSNNDYTVKLIRTLI